MGKASGTLYTYFLKFSVFVDSSFTFRDIRHGGAALLERFRKLRRAYFPEKLRQKRQVRPLFRRPEMERLLVLCRHEAGRFFDEKAARQGEEKGEREVLSLVLRIMQD